MGFFNKILEKIGLGKDKDKAASASAGATPQQTAPAAKKPAASASGRMEKDDAFERRPAGKPESAPMSQVDVTAHLDKLAAANPAKLNWKMSIVDLLKLLDLESSYDARKELAEELGCPAEMMGDSAKMNTWLHKEVLKKIAANGGNIPKELLD